MQKRNYAAIAAAAAVATIGVIAASMIAFKGDRTKPVRAATQVTMAEPDGAEDWMYLQRANPTARFRMPP
jgi:hypothetical protein